MLLTCAVVATMVSATEAKKTVKPSKSRIAVIDFREPSLSELFRSQLEKALEAEFLGSTRSFSLIYLQVTLPVPDLDVVVKRIVEQKPDIIYATTVNSAKSIRDLSLDIPIVFSTALDPKAFGLIENFQRPGKKMTGFISYSETFESRRQLIVESTPSVRSIGIVFELGRFEAKNYERWLSESRMQNVEIVPIEMPLNISDAELAKTIVTSKVDAFLLPASTLLRRRYKKLIEAINSTRKPSMYAHEDYVKAGGLMSYSHIEPDFAKEAARYLRQAIDSSDVGAIPVLLPTAFTFAINLDTIKTLRSPLTKAFIKRADVFFP